jgi:DNA-binding PadR family transcriptional regulator
MTDSSRVRPLSLASVRVLAAIARGTRHGFDIMEECGLPSGTVYPILARLEHAGLIRGKWEAAGVAQRDKRPPRRYYEISAAGSKVLARSTAYYRSLGATDGGPLPGPARG